MSSDDTNDSQKRPGLLTHLLQPVCFIGALLAVIGLGASLVALVADLFSETARPYQAIFTFMLYPAVMMTGLLIYALGIVVERRRRRKFQEQQVAWTSAIDLALRSHRLLFAGLTAIAAVTVIGSIVGSYRAYEFTESREFCAELCHLPMGPERVAHADSPHANVECVLCHVGPHVDDYIEAKLSGMRQVYQLFNNSFERPIHAPASKILPSHVVCESCHWPENYLGSELDNRVRYGYGLDNAKRSVHIMLRLGGGRKGEGNGRTNIHWHAMEPGKLTFQSMDDKKQEIARIRLKQDDGSELAWDLYDDEGRKYTDAEVELAPVHEMECLDCHNRPAHQFLTPDEAVDRSIENGIMEPSLPFLKRIAIKALSVDYASLEEARVGIRSQIGDYYRDSFDGTVMQRTEHVEGAIRATQAIYERNIFPEMRVDWETYPNNIGHRTSPGCFRCHGGRHLTEAGEALDGDCAKCHVFFERDRGGESLLELPADASFVHPFTHEKHYTDVRCWDCHTGASSPYSQCSQCHEKEMASDKMTFSCSACHVPGTQKVAESSCKPCHPTLDSKLHSHPNHTGCLSCHPSHNWAVSDHSSCATEACHKPAEVASWGAHPTEGSCPVGEGFEGVRASMWGLRIDEQTRAESIRWRRSEAAMAHDPK